MSHSHHNGHGHSHGSHSHPHGGETTKNIATAFLLNLGFAVVELVGGIATNSVAILSDALHDFGDSISLGVAWGLQKRSSKGRDEKFSYGYRRFSLLGSVFLSGVLLVSSIFIVSEAVQRLFDPQEVHAQGMLWLAIAGVAVNGFAVLRLKKGTSLNERAVLLHLMEDVMGWVAVLVVSVVMMLVKHPAVRLLDPLFSIGVTVWVLANVWGNMRDTFRILLQGTPEGIDVEHLTAEILAVEGVESLHDLHLWSQDGESHVMTLHAVIGEAADVDGIKKQIRAIGETHNADHVTVEFERPSDGDCEYASNDR